MNIRLTPAMLVAISGALLALVSATATTAWNMRGYILDAEYATWKRLAAEYEQKKSELDQARRDSEAVKGDAQKLQDSLKDRQNEIARLNKTITQLEHDLASTAEEREMGEGATWPLVPNRWVLGVQAITPQSVSVNLGNVNQNTPGKELSIGDIVKFEYAAKECVITLLAIDKGVPVVVKKSARFAFSRCR